MRAGGRRHQHGRRRHCSIVDKVPHLRVRAHSQQVEGVDHPVIGRPVIGEARYRLAGHVARLSGEDIVLRCIPDVEVIASGGGRGIPGEGHGGARLVGGNRWRYQSGHGWHGAPVDDVPHRRMGPHAGDVEWVNHPVVKCAVIGETRYGLAGHVARLPGEDIVLCCIPHVEVIPSGGGRGVP